ncbi:response regulator [Salinadaptatus halalkaliphilus]|uniref:Response regulator n=1 Tax=Salinadaptatus halalkaliphilus TaxID=2419781 RepID=A0A4S3TPG1_9EURY|nr:response regulator [Salinadaptatus halalkaliphilus]THE66249.1 response regulator [Salinadaptatus halalkaliphilus]
MSRRPNQPVEILLIEDNPGDVRLTQLAFEGVELDIELCVATDGIEALEVLSRRRHDDPATVPDLVLLDLNLPGMNGFGFLEAIQDDPILARLPVLVLTSSTACEDVFESYELAANAYLTKPTDPDEYAAMVESVAKFWFEYVALPSLPA